MGNNEPPPTQIIVNTATKTAAHVIDTRNFYYKITLVVMLQSTFTQKNNTRQWPYCY